MNRFTVVVVLALPMAILPLTGCSSSSKSSGSISKGVSGIISSPSASSSDSSSPEKAYKRDVRDYIAAHFVSGGDASTLREQIGKIAKDHGISDWETREATWVAAGQGLADAGFKPIQLEAFKANLATTPEQAQWLEKGYKQAK